MFEHKNQLNRRRFLGGTTAVVGATMLSSVMSKNARALSGTTPASSLLFDDFTEGTYQSLPQYTGSHRNVAVVPPDSGSLLGGHRYTKMDIARNDREQPLSIDTGNGYLNFSAGVDTYYRISVGYGFREEAGTIAGFPLHADLTPYTALRFRFAPICLLGSLNVTMYSSGVQVSYGSPQIDTHSSSWTYICAFDDFRPDPTFNYADVHHILFLIQAVGQFAIESVEAI